MTHPLPSNPHPLIELLRWTPPHWRVVPAGSDDLGELWAQACRAAERLDREALHHALDRIYTVERARVLGDGMGGEGFRFPNSVRAESVAHYAGLDDVNRARMALRRWAEGEAERMEREAMERAELRAGGE